jgi:hypothetical protein
MDISREKQREGVRGGLEQFRWESLRNQSHRDRQQYLGFSTKLGQAGRFGKYSTNDWWRTFKDGQSRSSNLDEEKSRLKHIEDELMMEALGVKPKRLLVARHEMNAENVNQVLKKEESIIPLPTKKSHESGAHRGGVEAEDLQMNTGLGFRKYLKASDWNDVCDVEEVEVFELHGEGIKADEPPRALLRTHTQTEEEPLIKQENVEIEWRCAVNGRETHDHRRKSRSHERRHEKSHRKSTSRDRRRHRSRSFNRRHYGHRSESRDHRRRRY